MAERIITIDIDPKTGDFTSDMAGFKGKGCKDIAKKLESLGKVTNETLKPEYYQGPGSNGTVSAGS